MKKNKKKAKDDYKSSQISEDRRASIMDVESPLLKSRRERRNSEESIMINQTVDDQFGEASFLGES